MSPRTARLSAMLLDLYRVRLYLYLDKHTHMFCSTRLVSLGHLVVQICTALDTLAAAAAFIFLEFSPDSALESQLHQLEEDDPRRQYYLKTLS